MEADNMSDKELDIVYDMLIGNINRIMVTKDKKELYTMCTFAGNRLMRLYMMRFKEIDENLKKED